MYDGRVEMLESAEAARRLGIKVETLYAYVSRGLIASHQVPGQRRRVFDRAEVERLAARRPAGRPDAVPLATIATRVTRIEPAGPAYRGRPVAELAGRLSFEGVTEHLWQAAGLEWTPLPIPPCPPFVRPSDRLRWPLVIGPGGWGQVAEFRALRPGRAEGVPALAARVLATMVAALAGPDAPVAPATATATATAAGPVGSAGPAAPAGQPVATTLAAALCDPSEASEPGAMAAALAPLVEVALVLLADHELATSTVAVRVAASTRASIIDALLVGLATVAGPLHAGASTDARALLAEAERDGAQAALERVLRSAGRAPGFGHSLYAGPDPRAAILLEHLRQAPGRPGAATTLAAVLLEASTRRLPAPNIDLALAAVGDAFALPRHSGELIFMVARCAGWVAHYLEELGEAPLRYRARAVNLVDRPPDGPEGGPAPTAG
jgi:citrate synthase